MKIQDHVAELESSVENMDVMEYVNALIRSASQKKGRSDGKGLM